MTEGVMEAPWRGAATSHKAMSIAIERARPAFVIGPRATALIAREHAGAWFAADWEAGTVRVIVAVLGMAQQLGGRLDRTIIARYSYDAAHEVEAANEGRLFSCGYSIGCVDGRNRETEALTRRIMEIEQRVRAETGERYLVTYATHDVVAWQLHVRGPR